MIPLSCLIASLAAVSWLQYNTTKAEGSVQHTQKVRLEAQRLLTATLDAETDVRGYLLTESEYFLDRYQFALATLPDALVELRMLVSDNPSQTQAVQEISLLVNERLASLERTLELYRVSQPDLASPEVTNLLFQGREKMLQTRNAIDAFLDEEERLQEIRSRRLQRQRSLTAIALFVFAGIGIAGSILSAYLLRRVNQALREREERYRQLVELCPDGIYIQENGKFIYANYAALQIYGATDPEQLIGRSVLDFVDPEYRQQASTQLQHLHSDRQTPTLIEKKLLKLDGSISYVEATAIPWAYDGEQAAQVVIRDITQRKHIEQALAEKQAHLLKAQEIGSMGSWENDLTTGTLKWSEQIYRIFGISQAEFSGDYEGFLNSVYPEDRQEVDRQIKQAIAGKGEHDFLHRILLPDGSVRWVREKAEVVWDSQQQPMKLMGTLQDVTDRVLAEIALAESKQRLDGILSSIEDVVWSASIEPYQFLYLNSATEKVFGRPVQHFFSIPDLWINMIHPEDRALVELQNRQSISRQTKDVTYRIVRPDGEIRWLHDRAKAVYDDRGVAIRIDGIATDITERKRAEEEIRRLNQTLERKARESETRYQQIVELAEEGIWVIDGNGITTYVNQAMARMLGYDIEEMIGQPLLDFLAQSDRSIARDSLTARREDRATRHEFCLKAKNGELVWTNISTSPVLNEQGTMLWACALVYDITERKHADEQLRQSNERISLINAELARATRLKDEFFASMSHELRTPLNAILGLSEALLEEVYGTLTDRQKRSLNTIENSGRHLLELINDILDLSKIESGKMDLHLTPVTLSNLCESSLNFVKQQAHQKRVRIYSQLPTHPQEILIDERRMRQVLVNLLSNAVKFTPEGGQVFLNVENHVEEETITFSVQDNGVGIAKENFPKLFQPFVQLDSSLSRRYAGTGLGLSLVRRIVELHGGSISLQSEVGKGSIFTITLPWKELESSSPTSIPLETGPVLPTLNQALVVEDSDPAAKQVARYLSELGAEVRIHSQGEGTIETVLDYHPDLIVLDLLLPNLSGWEVLAQLKSNPQTQNIPVLVISVVDDRSSGIDLGASEYLVKPITRSQLQSAISQIFATPSPQLAPTTLVVISESTKNSHLILLAEDNEANIATFNDYLQAQGFRVCIARNGLEAVFMTKQLNPQLILMDIQMPEMDGLEAIRRIRSNPEIGNIPIIALTALAMPGDREKCLAAGAQAYMTKPVSLKQLIHQISHYLDSE